MENPDVAARRKHILAQSHFTCQCDACVHDYKFSKLEHLSSFQEKPSFTHPKTYNDAVKELKKNYKFIRKHANNMMTQMNYGFMDRNYRLLSFIAALETFE